MATRDQIKTRGPHLVGGWSVRTVHNNPPDLSPFWAITASGLQERWGVLHLRNGAASLRQRGTWSPDKS